MWTLKRLSAAALVITLSTALIAFSTPRPVEAAACSGGIQLADGDCRFFRQVSDSQTFTVPSDWNNASNTIEAIGAGSAGAAGTTASGGGNGGGGGGGGAYEKISNQTLTISTTVGLHIGVGGVAGGLTEGSSTYFCTDNSGNCSLSGSTNGSSVVINACEASSPSGITGGAGGVDLGACGSGINTGSALGTVHHFGGNGGSSSNGSADGGGAGGGAGGPNGVGADGVSHGTNNGGDGGSGASGGTAGATATSQTGGNGGAGFDGTAGGTGGTTSLTGNGGSHGSGGGGGGGTPATAKAGAGGFGGAGVEYDNVVNSKGAGGGGGGGGGNTGGAGGNANNWGGNGGTGGNWGGGGGGGGGAGKSASQNSTGGNGGPGLLIITYTPASAPASSGTPARLNIIQGKFILTSGRLTIQ